MLLKILTFNAAIQDIRFFGHSFYCPVGHVRERLSILAYKLAALEADIICLQELFHRSLQDYLYAHLRECYPHACGFSARGIKLRLGNELLIFSRFPLAGESLIRFNAAAPEELRYTNKGFLHTSFTLEGHGTIDLVNFHTTAGGIREHPDSEKMNSLRSKQIHQILDYVRTSNPVILAGDLNAGPHSSMQNYRQLHNAGYIDTYSDTGGGEGYTWDPANPLVAAGAEAHLPPQRIDHIFIHSVLREKIRQFKSSIVLDEICVNTGSGELPLSDHYGVIASLQLE